MTFLEETFGASSAPPEHRLHRKAVQEVLSALLPEAGTPIKGQMRSETDLREASGYAHRPGDFDDLIRMLDRELRLISPTDPEGGLDGDAAIGAVGRRYYQLTHDYLVDSVREWLVRKRRETLRGRAEIRLAERSSHWNIRPENRQLPSIVEWATIRLFTRPGHWTEPQKRMMSQARRVHGLRATCLAIGLALAAWGSVEGFGNLRAAALVEFIRISQTSDVPDLVAKLAHHERWAVPRLRRLLAETPEDSPEHLHASLALLPSDSRQVDYLWRRLLVARPNELAVLRDALRGHRAVMTPRLWSALEAAMPAEPGLLATAGALALYDVDSPLWSGVEAKVADALVKVNSISLESWLGLLRPVREKLTRPLAAAFRDGDRSVTDRVQAANILSDYADDDPGLSADLLMDSELETFAVLFPVVERQVPRSLSVLEAELARRPPPLRPGEEGERDRDRLAGRQAIAAAALVRLGRPQSTWPLLRHGPDPRLRSLLIVGLASHGVAPNPLLAELDSIGPRSGPTVVTGPRAMEAILFDAETSARRALILTLGHYAPGTFPRGTIDPLVSRLIDLYRDDPDSGIHGAVRWALERWGRQAELEATAAKLAGAGGRDGRRWFVNGQGQTYSVVEGPLEFPMGSPPTEPDRVAEIEAPHRRVIPRRFAIATHEVTVGQFRKFVVETTGQPRSYTTRYSPDPAGPQIEVSWFDAAAYCNWLSAKEGLPREQWCYLPDASGKYGDRMTIPADALRRTGYRLPTEAEWEYACRAGAETSRYYGNSAGLLGRYAWYTATSGDRTRPCGRLLPNDLGLFDTLGNADEWCLGAGWPYPTTEGAVAIDQLAIAETVRENVTRSFRGGTFSDLAGFLRSANRDWLLPSHRSIYFGFRPARTLP